MLSKFFNWILYKINFWKQFFFNKYNFSVNWYERLICVYYFYYDLNSRCKILLS